MVSSMSRTRTTISGMELYSFLVQFVFLKQVHSVVEYSLNVFVKILLTLTDTSTSFGRLRITNHTTCGQHS